MKNKKKLNKCGETALEKVIRKIAKKQLKEFERQCDNDFLTRAELDRRLNGL